jgi:hypothetical protein
MQNLQLKFLPRGTNVEPFDLQPMLQADQRMREFFSKGFFPSVKSKDKKEQTKTKNYSTQYSRVVPHHSTDCAITSLTSDIRRDPVLSGVYGRS